MRPNCLLGLRAVRSLLVCILFSAGLGVSQTPQPQTGNSGFKVAPPKDEVIGKDAAAQPASRSQVSSPNRTVGPQQDGSIVVSDNQTLTPAGRIVELGAPVRAKAIALNPNGMTHSAAVLLMGSPQPILVFNTATGQVLQRFIPVDATAASAKDRSAGSFTGITYSANGSKLLFSQDNNYVVIANVNRKTGLLSNEQRVSLPEPPADGRPYHDAKAINPGGIALSGDGKRAYVVLNAANTLGVIDLAGSPARLIGQIPVGNVTTSAV